MQIDSESKIIYVHIPRTGGSWFTHSWNSRIGIGDIRWDIGLIIYHTKDLQIDCGRHGRLSGIKEKLQSIKYNFEDHQVITLVREPFDRIGSSWIWFNNIKCTASKHGWKSIDDMLDEYEGGGIRVNYLPQTYWLEEEGAHFDKIYRFEDLIGSDQMVLNDFPHFNRATKTNCLKRLGVNRASGFSTKQKERIKKLYKDDFNYLAKYYE